MVFWASWENNWFYVAASDPTITSSSAAICMLPGQNVSLTCKVIYNGTNLMPLTFQWFWTRLTNPNPEFWYRNYGYSATTNSSAVHQSSLAFTATGRTTDIYWCIGNFSSPSGLVLPGVQEQSWNAPDYTRSSRFFYPRTVTSEIPYTLWGKKTAPFYFAITLLNLS